MACEENKCQILLHLSKILREEQQRTHEILGAMRRVVRRGCWVCFNQRNCLKHGEILCGDRLMPKSPLV